jgi:flavin-dependent dehydrogenase
MSFLEEAGLLDRVVQAQFQFKDGAVFRRGTEEVSLDFREKTSVGWGTTFQVKRDIFDDVLAKGAADMGADLTFGDEVTSFSADSNCVRLTIRDEAGAERAVTARFALDASGFGRVLARLLSLDKPSDFPVRKAVFCHVNDNISDATFDRNKILVGVNPDNPAIWYWLIPLAGGLSSIGAVGPVDEVTKIGPDSQSQLFGLIAQCQRVHELLSSAEQVRPADTIVGYARKVDSLFGRGFALLGNAAEFLDPVFSSGVTIALKSAILASRTLDRQLKGESVDWMNDFERPLMVGIDTFRAYVEGWYDGSFQDIIFRQPRTNSDVKRKIVSVLAGYAWDSENPFVRAPQRYLAAVRELSRS